MFIKAKPTWLKGLENEMNIQAVFTADFEKAEDVVLSITGATAYRVYINGKLLHYGPARTAKGYARVDRVNVPAQMLCENNTLRIDAVNYYCNSFYFIRQTGFICAELSCGDKVLAATGYDFKGFRAASRLQKVMRYSGQRCFTEVWDLSLADAEHDLCCPDVEINYLVRRAPLPDMSEVKFDKIESVGKFGYANPQKPHRHIRFVNELGEQRLGFPVEELEEAPFYTFDQFEYSFSGASADMGAKISCNEFAFIDCKKNHSGMIHLKFKAEKEAKIIVAFDERLKDGCFDHTKWEMLNLIRISSAGDTDFTTFDIYGFRYAAVFVIEGEIELNGFSVIQYKNPIKNPPALKCDDNVVLKIYEAAVETLRQNSVDIYMDCPTRERAGWLCDSYFSAQAEYAFTGKCDVEDDFMENYLLQSCPDIPEKMLPMCYPSDHFNKNFIPQWAMWFVMEAEQYAKRNPSFDLERLRGVAYGLVEYFGEYENEYGLLENLPAWNFVEWSKANEWTSGVNFPTNMLYSYSLRIIGNLFNDKKLLEKAQSIIETVVKLSFNGEFFRDQAYRDENNRLITYPDRITEVCQYYAFRFGTATPEKFTKLYNTLLTDFYPNTEKWPEIYKINVLPGMYIRMELLYIWGEHEMLVNEIKEFFGHMADITGTLWEHKDVTRGSLNHGFASYVGALMLNIYNK